MTDHRHAEAFCLMRYRSDDGLESEMIWNSRDGVTPFIITLRSGKQASHVDWRSDLRVPDYQPEPGSRIFVDLTEERAREAAERMVDRHPEAAAHYGTRKNAVAALTRSYLQPGAPDLIEVTE